MMNISVTKTANPKEKPDSATVPFGVAFTDHMFMMDYNDAGGWHNPRIVPYGDIHLNPGALVFHYGAEVFEGLKAYRAPDGQVQMFRPDANISRMNDSAERLCLPKLDEEMALEALKAFVSVEKDWVPEDYGTSLYLRPFLFGTDPDLSLHGIHHAQFMIIACPVGSYYKGGLQPVELLIEKDDVRAVKGGTGYAKCGGNYAAATRAGEKAAEKGYSQVLWLDGVERKYVEEGGGMNVMFVWNGKLVTPELNGSILPGVTRRSILAMAQNWGMETVERKISVDELMEACRKGEVQEAFMCGTAAVVTPIGGFAYGDEKIVVNHNEIGAVTQKIYDELTGIQWGLKEDSFGWTVKVN